MAWVQMSRRWIRNAREAGRGGERCGEVELTSSQCAVAGKRHEGQGIQESQADRGPGEVPGIEMKDKVLQCQGVTGSAGEFSDHECQGGWSGGTGNWIERGRRVTEDQIFLSLRLGLAWLRSGSVWRQSLGARCSGGV
ncbi:hypothetical protein E2C01_030118 [Portunus trituberculatus]|uniref:Uncharacterized protein n=1 Tax=Portunus trituberculatus TaxID=210409 RepID=A0A5B7EQ34_PORTR|nr:hypothetical protein [Portunus trituberculatus]